MKNIKQWIRGDVPNIESTFKKEIHDTSLQCRGRLTERLILRIKIYYFTVMQSGYFVIIKIKS